MKKLTTLTFSLILILLFNGNIYSQFNYIRSSFAGTYTPITTGGGATISTATGDAGFQTGVPIGFTFNYDGVNYTTLGIATDGYASFTYTASSLTNTNLYTVTAPNATLAPYWDDLSTSPTGWTFPAGQILYQTQGSTGSRTFTIQWTGVASYYTTTAPMMPRQLNFQIILFEGSNRIEFRYGSIAGTTYYTSESASIGIESHAGGNGNYIDAITGSKYSNNSFMTSNKWPTLFYRFDPGTPTPLSGSYNVGIGQTYPTISEAIADLNHRGVSGAVTLNLTDANYDSTTGNIYPLVLGPISGTSVTNTVTIQQLIGSSILTFGGTLAGNIGNQATTTALSSSNEPILALVGASYVTIKNLNFYSTTTYGHGTTAPGTTFQLDRGIEIINSSTVLGSTNNTIQNCGFRLGKIISTGTAFTSYAIEQLTASTPISPSGANSYNKYYNLLIDSAYYGINLSGNASFPDYNTEIGGVSGGTCTIGGNWLGAIGNNSTANFGIQALNQYGIGIYNCLVRNVYNSSASTVYGIYLQNNFSSGIYGTANIYNNEVTQIDRTYNASGVGTVYGIYATGLIGNTINIYNNVVDSLNFNSGTLTTTPNVAGIGIFGAANYNINYNSVNLIVGNNAAYNCCFYIGSTGGYTDYRNNAFSNKSLIRGAATTHNVVIYRNSTSQILTASNNVLHALNLGAANYTYTVNTTNISPPRLRLADWQTAQYTASGLVYYDTWDMGSTEGNPLFNSATDLTLTAGSSAINSGRPIPGITTDKNGNARDANNPDIGAFESAPLSTITDTHGPYLSYTPIPNSSTPTLNLTVTDNVNGAPGTNSVRLWYRLAGSAVAFTGLAPDVVPGGGLRNGLYQWTTSLSALAANQYEYYISVRDGITNNTSITPPSYFGNQLPPVGSMSFTTDPTASNYGANPIAGVDFRRFTKLSSVVSAGTYEIGDDQPAGRRNLTQLASTILSSEYSGNVIYELNTTYGGGLYPETFPITFSPFVTTGGASYTITVRPKAGVTGRITQGNPVGALIIIDGTDRITFDGRAGGTSDAQKEENTVGYNPLVTREWTLRHTGTSYPVFQFQNDASNNTLQYLAIEGGNLSTGTIYFATTTTPNGGVTGNDYNVIDNCDIRDRSDIAAGTGTMFSAIYSSGTTTTVPMYNSNNSITNNNIYNFRYMSSTSYGIYLSSGNTDWTISGNSFYQQTTITRTVGTTDYTIYITNTTGNNFNISNNYFGGSAPLCGGSAWTVLPNTLPDRYCALYINVGTGTPTSVQGNTFANWNFNTNSSATAQWGMWCGIYVNAGNVDIGTTTGNTIGSGTGTGSISVTLATNSGGTVNPIVTAASSSVVNIYNNTIGSINAVGGASQSAGVFGIYNYTGSSQTTINNNLIGSLTTPNSINATFAGSSATGQQVIGIYSVGSNLNNAITNNTIANLNNNYIGTVSNGWIKGIYTTSGVNNISGNIIRNLTSSGLYSASGTGATVVGIHQASTVTPGSNIINGNTIHSLSNTTVSATAVYVTGIIQTMPTSGTQLTQKNFIHSLTTTSTSTSSAITGIYVASGISSIQNNMIRLGIDAAGSSITTPFIFCGIDKATTTLNNILFNSIYIGGSGVGATANNTFALRNTAAGPEAIKNNILVNARSNATTGGNHYAINLSTNIPLTSDYNFMYSPGTGGNIGLYSATICANIGAWKSASGLDANSQSANPNYVNPTGNSSTVDLHIANPTPIEGVGIAIGSVTDDFDGQSRAGLTPTDMGADAENFTYNDLMPPTITYTPLPNTTSILNVTTGPGFATITDVSGINTTSGTRPRLYYKKFSNTNSWNDNTSGTDGWKYAEANGLGSSPFDFTIDYSKLYPSGTVTQGDVIQYFVIAQDLALTPNVGINSGTFASTPSSVALTSTAFPIGGTINLYAIQVDFNGIYTVGTGGNFLSLTNSGGLFQVMNSSFLSGNVTVNIISDLTSESGTYALNQWTETGIGNYSLSINPDAPINRTISGSYAGGLIRLNGADRVTIDGNYLGGKYLTFQNNYLAGTCATIQLASLGAGLGCNNVTIKNCTIKCGNVSTSPLSIGISIGGAVGATGADNDNCSIQNNDISKAYYGIYAGGTASTNPGAMDNLVVTGNKVGSNVMTDIIYYTGMMFANTTGTTISGNTIFNIKTTALTPLGLNIATGFVNSTISKNNINNIVYTGTGGYGARGINMSTGTSPTNVTIANNIIYQIGGDGWSSYSASSPVGMYFDGTMSGLNIYFNSIYMSNPVGYPLTQSSTLTTAILFNTSTITNISLRNNVFQNSMNNAISGTSKQYAIDAQSAAQFFTINYNDYWSPTPIQGVLGRLAGVEYTTLAAWQGATLKDSSSLNSNPTFNSETNLQPLPGSPLVGTAALGTGISDDILGNLRSGTSPTIGAYENVADQAGPTITYSPLSNTTSTLNRTTGPGFATITDISGVNYTAGTKPRMYYKKSWHNNTYVDNSSLTNGWKYVEEFSGSSPSDFTIDYSILFGGSASSGDVIQYFVVAQDLFVVPNVSINSGTFATNPTSVSLTAGNFPLSGTINQYVINASGPLAGDYTVGLSMFNKITGKNLEPVKMTRKVKIEINQTELKDNPSSNYIPLNARDYSAPQHDIEQTDAQSSIQQNGFNFQTSKNQKKFINQEDKQSGLVSKEMQDYIKTGKDIGLEKRTPKKTVEVDEEYYVLGEKGVPYTGPLYVAYTPEIRQRYGLSDALMGNYANISSAIADLNAVGIGANVRFILIDANYGPSGTAEAFPITVNPYVVNTDPPSTVTILPQNGVTVTISGNSPSQIFDLNGADWFRFDGRQNISNTPKQLTIRNTNSTSASASVIRFINDATNNKILYSVIEGTTQGQTQGLIWFGSALARGNDSITVDNNDIRNRSDSTDGCPTVPIYCVGTAVSGYCNDNVIISNNNIFNYYNSLLAHIGIYFNGGGDSSYTISGNSFYQTVTRTPAAAIGFFSMLVAPSTVLGNNFIIIGNYIGGTAPQCGGTPMTYTNGATYPFMSCIRVFYVNGAIPSYVRNNIITNISYQAYYTATSSNIFKGIDVISTTNYTHVTDNIIGAESGNGAITLLPVITGAGAPSAYGIYSISNTIADTIRNNKMGSISINSSYITGATATLTFYGIYVSTTGVIPFEIKDNKIGSTVTSNSIYASDVNTPTQMYGIYCSVPAGGYANIQRDTISNITNSTTGSTSVCLIRGIYYIGAATDTIKNCVINEISTASTNTLSAPTTCAAAGIVTTSTSLNQNISGNIIKGIRNTSPLAISTTVMGIATSGASSTGIIGMNRIYDMTNLTTGGASGLNGINNSAATSAWTVLNNQITLTNGELTTDKRSKTIISISDLVTPVKKLNKRDDNPKDGPLSTNSVVIRGIGDFGTGTWTYYYNSIYIGGSASTGTANSYALYRGSTSTATLRNNLFLNARTGGTGNHYAVSSISGATGWTSAASNYNVFVSSNANTVGEWTTGLARSIEQWRGSSGGDSLTWSTTSSVINASNLFTSIANGNLNINNGNAESWLVSGKGIFIPSIGADFNGDARAIVITSGCTDIGADEFGLPTVDPVLATQVGTPSNLTQTLYTLWGRTLCYVDWYDNGAIGTTYPSNLNVKYWSGVNPDLAANGYSNSYLDITPVGTSDVGYNITICFGDNEINNITTPGTNTVLAKKETGGAWEVFPAYVSGGTMWKSVLNYVRNPKWVKVDSLYNFSNFTLTDATSPLPVQLASFTANLNKRDVTLSWVTVYEHNNKGFYIERRKYIKDEPNNIIFSDWNNVQFVTGGNNTNTQKTYSYIDKKVNIGKYQYRLKQEDFNGNAEYFNLLNPSDVVIGKPNDFDISQNYPNPSSPVSKIDYALPFKAKVSIKIYDIIGREVTILVNDIKDEGYYTALFDGTNLSSGTYFYMIVAEGYGQKFTKTMKMILVK